MRAPLLTVLALAVLALVAPAAQADPPPPGSTWTQATITEPDGTRLHADVLRPSNLPADAKTPGHRLGRPVLQPLRADGAGRPGRGHALRPDRDGGPVLALLRLHQRRAADGARLHVRDGRPARVRRLVGLPGLGRAGRAGRRQGRRASGPRRSRGRPATSACTASPTTASPGSWASRSSPPGLDAVVSQEPVYDMYRYLYSNRVRFANSFADARRSTRRSTRTPGSIQDDPGYNVNGADNTARPGCYAANYLDQQSDDHGSAYWKSRDLIAKARGLDGAALHDPGLHREQHQARRRVRLLQRRRRPQARVVRDVGPRARQRRRRERAPGHGPPRLVRRGHALLRPVPARRRRRPCRTRRSRWRPATARGAARPAGRRPTPRRSRRP